MKGSVRRNSLIRLGQVARGARLLLLRQAHSPPALRSEIAFLKGRPLVTNDTHPSSADSSIRVSFSIEVDERGTDERGFPSVSIHFLLGFFSSWKQHLFDSRPRRSARETCPDRWRTLRPKGGGKERERERDSGNDAVGNAVSGDNGGENPRPRFLYLFVHAILAGHAFDEISGFPTRRELSGVTWIAYCLA